MVPTIHTSTRKASREGGLSRVDSFHSSNSSIFSMVTFQLPKIEYEEDIAVTLGDLNTRIAAAESGAELDRPAAISDFDPAKLKLPDELGAIIRLR